MKSLLKYFKKSAVVAGCVFTALILLSCENFLDSGDVKKQLDELIEEANAKTFTIVVSQENTMGTFLSSGDKPCKIGKSIEVQFNLNKDAYIYNGLKAVSTSNREEDRSDCVQFTSLEKDYQQGVYKTSIKLVKEAGDILIVPDCTLVPGVITDQCEPKNQYSGCHQDTTVRIVFNKPVSETGFKEYINLSITDVNGQSLTSYYKTPYFTDNNTILNLPTNSEKRLVSANDSADTKEITITIDLSKVQDTEGNSGSGLFQYKYHVNKTLDDAAPYLDTDSVTVYSTSDTQRPFYKQLETNEWSSSWTMPDYEANHINNSIYIELEGSDADSGVGEILVKEKLFRKTDTSDPNATAVEYTLKCTPTDQPDSYAFNYTLQEAYDGIIELEIFLRDNAGNPSTESKKIYVLKDTLIDDSKVSFKEEWKNRAGLDNSNEIVRALSDVDANGVQTVKLHLYKYAKDIYYGSYSSDFDVDLFWGYSKDTIETPVTKTGDEYTFNRDSDKPVFIKVLAQDSVGNKTEIIKSMDPRCDVDSLIPFEDNTPEEEGVYNKAGLKIHINNLQLTQYLMGYKSGSRFNFMYYYDENGKEYSFTGSLTTSHEDEWAKFCGHASTYVGVSSPPKNQLIRVYIFTTLGDFTGPVSKNYIEFNAKEWDKVLNGATCAKYPKSYNYGPVLKSNSTTPTVSYEPGPYIGQVISVESYKVPNSGLCKLKLDEFNVDYMAWWADIIAGTGSGNILDYLLNLNTDVQYTVKAVDTTDSSKYYTNTEPELYVTPGTYKLYVEATGPDGTIYKPYQDPNSSSSDHFSIKVYTSDGPTITATDNSITVADFDAIAPEFYSPQEKYKRPDSTGYFYWYENENPFSTIDSYEIIVPEDSSGIRKNSSGKCEIYYYLIPNLKDDVYADVEYTLKTLNEDYADLKKTFTYAANTASGTSLYLPYDDLPEGVYNICILVYDTKGNYKIKTYPFVNKTIGAVLQYEWNPSTKTLSLKNDGRKTECKVFLKGYGNRSYPTKSCFIQEYDEDSKKWVYDTFSDRNYSETNGHFKDDRINLCVLNCLRKTYVANHTTTLEYKYTYDTNNPVPNTWVKLCGYYGCDIYDGAATKVDVIPQQDEGFYYFEYAYLGSETAVCTLKNCIQGFAGIQVYNDTDKTAFCHTMYSTEKITDTSSETNARIWETKGTETGVKFKSGNFTYGSDQLAGVPAGAWYTTIVHFADGTIAMSDIKRK